jgi:WD40 repeat protein
VVHLDDDVTLTNPNLSPVRHVRLSLDGATLTRETWAGTGKRRMSTKVFPTAGDAAAGLAADAVGRMKKGFMHLRAAADTPRGGLVLRCVTPDGNSSMAFDLAPDGGRLAVASVDCSARVVNVRLLDVATGVLTLLHTEPARDTRVTRDAVQFDGAGGLVFSVPGVVRHLDTATGAVRTAETIWPGARHFGGPSWNEARSYFLAYDDTGRIQLFDAGLEPLHELRAETRAGPARPYVSGAVSPSGSLVALGTADGEIDVVDTLTGQSCFGRSLTLPGRRSAARLGFDPAERVLVASCPSGTGPFIFRLADGSRHHVPVTPDRPGTFATCCSWAFSPDGTKLVVAGSKRLYLHDGATFERLPAEPLDSIPWSRALRFSADGTMLAVNSVGAHQEMLSVYRI